MKNKVTFSNESSLQTFPGMLKSIDHLHILFNMERDSSNTAEKRYLHPANSSNLHEVYACLSQSRSENWESGERYGGNDAVLRENASKNLSGTKFIPYKILMFRSDTANAKEECESYITEKTMLCETVKWIGYLVSGSVGAILALIVDSAL